MTGARRIRLRTRVLALVLSVLVVSFAVVLVLTTVLLQQFLVTRLDQQLSDAGQRFVNGLPVLAQPDDRQFDRVAGQPAGYPAAVRAPLS